MTKVGITLDDRQHQIQVNRLVKKYRRMMFEELALTLDVVRLEAASKEIIPHAPNVRYGMSPYKMRKLQPANPTRLTNRTGLLIKMLKNRVGGKNSNWEFKTKTARHVSNALLGGIRVTDGYKTTREEYKATLRTKIETIVTGEFNGKKIKGFKKGLGLSSEYRTYETPQTAAIRFKHETGIRGRARPFLNPAATKNMPKTKGIIAAKLQALGGL